ncbi:DMT family transporter [Roseomonas sp. GC11]|uniref:DMT family transporter n=1 Tax=Roseomonas sp. GC11 TaxID=2950546 RepID=UPI00210C11A7|nr:DMT family transporter [Roseomonas sp. GC11]MCQ4158484.1 DMT family transporter [Roseomonas sp. GC11]
MASQTRAASSSLAGRLWQAPTLLLCLAALFWSGNFVLGRALNGTASPFFLAFWRWVVALAVLLPFAWPHLRRDGPVLRAHPGRLLLLALLGVASFSVLVYQGLRSTTAINGLLLQSVIPVAILLCAFLLFGERPGARQMLGVAFSIAGVAAIACHGSLEDLLRLSLHPGDLWVLGAVLSYAVYSTCLRLRPRLHPLSFLTASIALSLPPLALGYALEGSHPMPAPGALLALGYLAVFPSLLAYLFFNRGVELIGAARAGQFIHLMPLFGSGLAVLFLGERLQLFHAAGLALIGGGIALSMSRSRGAAPGGGRSRDLPARKNPG